jgi:hypothetical protein
MERFSDFRKQGPGSSRIPKKPSEIKKQLNDYIHANWKVWVMADEMLQVVYGELFYIKENEHVKWLSYTLKNLINKYDNTDEGELHPMMYGMINENIKQCLLAYSRFIRNQFPDVFKAMKTQADAEFYFAAACDAIFVHEDRHLHLVSVRELIEITGSLLMERKVQDNVYFEDVNMGMAAHILNLAEKDEYVLAALSTYKTKLKDAIRRYLEEGAL